jgi:hypothetical protein
MLQLTTHETGDFKHLHLLQMIAECKTDIMYLTGWSSGNAVDFYSEGAVFESRLGYRLSWEVFRGFPQSLQAYVGILPLLGQDRFLPNPFPLISSVVKITNYTTRNIVLLNNPREEETVTLIQSFLFFRQWMIHH